MVAKTMLAAFYEHVALPRGSAPGLGKLAIHSGSADPILRRAPSPLDINSKRLRTGAFETAGKGRGPIFRPSLSA